MLVVAATPSRNGYGARPTQSVGHGPWSMKHGGMPRYALKCKLVSHRVGVDGTSGPSLLGCPLDASTQRVRARGNTCPRCAHSSFPLSLSLVSPRRLFSSTYCRDSLHHGTETQTASPWHGDRGSWGIVPLCPKVPFLPLLSPSGFPLRFESPPRIHRITRSIIGPLLSGIANFQMETEISELRLSIVFCFFFFLFYLYV